MATAQKRGFRFPWGGDGHNDDADASGDRHGAAGDEASDLARRLGEVADDLGRGPFDLEAPEAEDNASATESEPADASAAESGVERTAPEAAPVKETDVVGNEVAMQDATTEPESSDAQVAWPDVDHRPATPAAPVASAVDPDQAARRRDNPLVAGLVRAMRDAARTARDEAVAGLRAESVARGDAIREQSTQTTTELRKLADADVASIREWSKAEIARVREETEARIAERRSRLVEETEAEARHAEAVLIELTEAVTAFEGETERFFEALLAEDDPARLAGLAERMPLPPSLDDFVVADHATADAMPANPPDAPSTDDERPDDGTDETVASVTPEDAVSTTPDDQADDRLDPHAAAEAEAEALEGLDRQTQLVVTGLSSVGAIAGLKAELVRAPGVTAVNVNAGSSGDFVFTVTHDAGADLRTALSEMTAYETRVVADDGDTLVVVAREPAVS
jgi:hypothetical protein